MRCRISRKCANLLFQTLEEENFNQIKSPARFKSSISVATVAKFAGQFDPSTKSVADRSGKTDSTTSSADRADGPAITSGADSHFKYISSNDVSTPSEWQCPRGAEVNSKTTSASAWSCSRCTFLNSETTSVCDMCGSYSGRLNPASDFFYIRL